MKATDTSNLPNDQEWELVQKVFLHAARIKSRSKLYAKLKREEPQCIGSVRKFQHRKAADLILHEFYFFNREIPSIKIWAFKEDFGNGRQQGAIFYKKQWFLKEEGEHFEWLITFSRGGIPIRLKIRLVNAKSKTLAEINYSR